MIVEYYIKNKRRTIKCEKEDYKIELELGYAEIIEKRPKKGEAIVHRIPLVDVGQVFKDREDMNRRAFHRDGVINPLTGY